MNNNEIKEVIRGLENCLNTLLEVGEREKAITILNEIDSLRRDYIATGYANTYVLYELYYFIRNMCDKIYSK